MPARLQFHGRSALAAQLLLQQLQQRQRDTVVILNDGARRARDPDRRKHVAPNIRRWMGDSIGWWKATRCRGHDELHGQDAVQRIGDRHVVERIRRVDANTPVSLHHRGSETWDRSWTGEYPWKATKENLRYACHEGNYALTNMLKGARLKEAEDAAKKPQ
jgi:hypothetical protein